MRSIAVADGVAYVVGSSTGAVNPSSSYTSYASPSRNYAFAVSSAENWTGTTADLKDWNPRPSALVSKVWATGGSVYLSGNFVTLNPSGAATVARNYLAAVDTSANWSSVTADVQSWYPQPSAAGSVSELAVGSAGVYLAGTFTTVNPGGTGAVARNYAAAVALPGAWAGTAGDLLSWNPNLNASASTVAVDGTTVYLGGTFTTVGGTARNRAAALNTSGTLQAWNPNVTNTVNYLQVLSDKVYLSTESASVGDYSPQSSTSGSVFVKKAADWSAGSTSNVLAYRGPYGRFSRVASSGRVVGNTSSASLAVLVYTVTAVDEAVPMAAPGAPTGLSVVAGPTQVTVSWTAPATNGSAVTGYTVTPYNSSGGSVAVSSQTVSLLGRTTVVFTGLTAATGYTFKVQATNAYGNSAASSLSSVATTP